MITAKVPGLLGIPEWHKIPMTPNTKLARTGPRAPQIRAPQICSGHEMPWTTLLTLCQLKLVANETFFSEGTLEIY